MGNPYLDEARSSRATKMETMGVGGYPDARQRARGIAPPVKAEQGNPAAELREGRLLSRDPIEAARQLNDPLPEKGIGVRAGLPDGRQYGHQD